MRLRKEKDFLSFFDEKTGKYFRTGIICDGKDTGADPFMASFPELLDVGIMGHCRHGKSGLCIRAGIECYQDGLHADAPNMSLEDFRRIAEQCQGRTYQFALGGCGDPDQHEQFEEILKICRNVGIVPNFTTSGLGMTSELARICKEYCGAVAVSWYRSPYTIRAIQMLLDAGVKTNIHYVLNNQTLAEAIFQLRGQSQSEQLCQLSEPDYIFPEGVNAVIFLLHKPVGLGTQEKVISFRDPLWKEFLTCVSTGAFRFRIGFDSCTVPALIQHAGMFDLDSLDTCEGARWSAYITPDMKMLPCSFDNQKQKWAVDLGTYTIEAAWNSNVFEEFRSHFRNACPECRQREQCLGGCPICPEIVMCELRG